MEESSLSVSENDLTEDPNDECIMNFLTLWYNICDQEGYNKITIIGFLYARNQFYIQPCSYAERPLEEYMSKHYENIYSYALENKRKLIYRVVVHEDTKQIMALYMKGPILDAPLMKSIGHVCEQVNTIRVLRLIDCSLKSEAVIILSKHLKKTLVTHLYLDRNPIPDQNFHLLLQDNVVLEHLSLRLCQIDKKGIELLAEELGPYFTEKPHQRLKSLNLNNNRIDCLAMKYLAQSLRWNRQLVFLSLAGNNISNQGLDYLCRIFIPSELSVYDLKMRRKRVLGRCKKVGGVVDKELNEPLVVNSDSFTSIDLEDDRGFSKIIQGDKVFPKEVDAERIFILEELGKLYISHDENPLVRDVIKKDDKYVGDGNRTLLALNICYNKIEEGGFKPLLDVLLYHKELGITTVDNVQGLRYIEYLGNPCPNDSPLLENIQTVLTEIRKMDTQKKKELRFPS